MSAAENELTLLFSKSAEEVATNIATSWVKHEDRKKIMPGNGKIFAVQTESGNLFYRLEEAIVYSHEYTMKRWPNSHGPEIAQMTAAEVIGYQFHSSVLPFIKVGDFGSAANIQFSRLRAVDSLGEPVLGEESKINIGPNQLSRLIGLRHEGIASLTPFDLRGNRALLLSTGPKELTPEELKRIEEEILREDF